MAEVRVIMTLGLNVHAKVSEGEIGTSDMC